MRRTIGCLVFGALAAAALRHLGGAGHAVGLLRHDGWGAWAALSFALAAVVDVHRRA